MYIYETIPILTTWNASEFFLFYSLKKEKNAIS